MFRIFIILFDFLVLFTLKFLRETRFCNIRFNYFSINIHITFYILARSKRCVRVSDNFANAKRVSRKKKYGDFCMQRVEHYRSIMLLICLELFGFAESYMTRGNERIGLISIHVNTHVHIFY